MWTDKAHLTWLLQRPSFPTLAMSHLLCLVVHHLAMGAWVRRRTSVKLDFSTVALVLASPATKCSAPSDLGINSVGHLFGSRQLWASET